MNQKRYKQKRPYNLNLPYSSRHAKVLTRRNGVTSPASTVFGAGWDATTERNQAASAAYEKLKGKISDRASMGENLGQLGSSARLVAEKAGIVLDALRRLRRLDVSAFAKWMDTGFLKRNSRFAAQTTLELNFAILPSINDIYSAVNILQEPVKDSVIQARASVPKSWTVRGSSEGFSPDKVLSAKVSAEYGCMVAVTNPNLHLADAMGLINPAVIAWQLLPGSFLVDWFIPIEQFLGMATDFCGLTLKDPYTTSHLKGHYYETWRAYGWFLGEEFCQTDRALGITLPDLRFRPLKNPSLRRAANAVSLLVQAFVKR